MIKELQQLSDAQQKRFYRMLTSELLKQFANSWYEADESEKLQKHFMDWKWAERKDYHVVLDRILAGIIEQMDLDITLTWVEVKINYRRWRICPVCNRPFLCYSKFNKVKTCYTEDYIRYKIGEEKGENNEEYVEGRYFKASEEGQSKCFMIYQATTRRKRKHKEDNIDFSYIKPF